MTTFRSLARRSWASGGRDSQGIGDRLFVRLLQWASWVFWWSLSTPPQRFENPADVAVTRRGIRRRVPPGPAWQRHAHRTPETPHSPGPRPAGGSIEPIWANRCPVPSPNRCATSSGVSSNPGGGAIDSLVAVVSDERRATTDERSSAQGAQWCFGSCSIVSSVFLAQEVRTVAFSAGKH